MSTQMLNWLIENRGLRLNEFQKLTQDGVVFWTGFYRMGTKRTCLRVNTKTFIVFYTIAQTCMDRLRNYVHAQISRKGYDLVAYLISSGMLVSFCGLLLSYMYAYTRRNCPVVCCL
jgi:hypothetical protein